MLKKLYQLQLLDKALAELDAERVNSDEYRQLRSIRAGFESGKERYGKLNAEIAKVEGRLKASAGRLEELEGKIAQEKQAMYDGSVTNARELAARQSQLANMESKLEEAQNDRAQRRQQLMAKQEEAAKLRASLTDLQTDFSRIRDLYQLKQEERDVRCRQLTEERQALLPEIDAVSLNWFESARDKFAGAPVARLDKSQICGGCHTMVPPATYRRAAQGQRTCCENCGRTLFVDD